MTTPLAEIMLVSAAGGIIGLDRTAAGQFMISQPIIAGPLIGWILGDAWTGLIIGAVLELIWVMDLPVGTFVPADSTVAAVWATAVAILAGGGRAPLPVIGFSLLLTVLLVPVTMALDGIVRKWNARLAASLNAGPEEQMDRRLTRAHLSGLVVFFVKSFVVYLLFIPVGIFLIRWLMLAPEQIQNAMALFLTFLPALGVASAARKLTMTVLDRFFMTGFVAAAVLVSVFPLNAFFVILLVAAGGWAGATYREA